MLNTSEIRKDFPILKRKIKGKDLVYLDNAATSQKPTQVINSVVNYYEKHNSNVHRGVHTLSEESTGMYEKARQNVADFIGAVRPKEIIFTSGTTESLNLVAFGWAHYNLTKKDEIIVTNVEHHSNLVPWQQVSEHTGAVLTVIDISDSELMPVLKQEMSKRVKLIVIGHASNVTGAITPIKEVTKLARKNGAYVVVDGAQAVPHFEVNMQSLDCDFYAFSAHKMLGPTGVGVLWARSDLLEELHPVQFGGGMIDAVEDKSSTWTDAPERYEAGTPNVAGVVGFSAAIDYLRAIGMGNIREHELKLNRYALEVLQNIDRLHILGPNVAEKRTGLVSFYIEDVHAHDISAILDIEGVAVRSGQHCTMPLHNKLGISSSTRASFYIYNTKQDIDRLAAGISKALEVLK